jgi:hypothetical protein
MNRQLLSKRAIIVLKDNKFLFLFLFAWFLGGFLIHYCLLKYGPGESLMASFFLKQSGHDFSSAYAIWSQGIIFGAIFSLLFQNIVEKYNPERGCRMIAGEMKNHIVVIGYTHLGERLIRHFREKKMPYCLIEKDKEHLDELLRLGEPVVVDNAKEMDALSSANIGSARVVILASNNLETALIVTKRVRQMNKDCRIIARCFQDEFVEILEHLGANEVISSSKNAFDDIVGKI